MIGEKELGILLSSMAPILEDSIFVFCLIKSEDKDIINYKPWAIIHEEEGTTVIMLESTAKEHRLEYEGQFKRITLNVHSSLEAVGLTAAIASELAKYKITANVVAGYFHDHIFIQSSKAIEALKILNRLSQRKLTTVST